MKNKKKNKNGLKVNDKVWINKHCIFPYIGMTGIILDINEETTDGDFIFHIKFDVPFESGLDNEYFSPNEVDLYDQPINNNS